MITEKASRQLAAIDHLNAMLDASQIDHWLIGGRAVDFHAGRITREHKDTDLVILHNDLPRINQILKQDGWKHSPKQDEDGGTGYKKALVRLEHIPCPARGWYDLNPAQCRTRRLAQ